ncbi:LLM class F420-dependent oxidoreductase [Actinomadura sp. 7K507]|uniref:LLM class F420-dependent oxidoreductase n=1 Tax=Actinomadura sp. 7K507 TaxID=2530365 RepID=UPI00104C5166|nr:LLM class F420-dependent oxidoreductase [Actinomadura sp. 7K507]TDC82964.1 LLM class F420-dependent oxidoreductase [Actinomadura sp. 7K507]
MRVGLQVPSFTFPGGPEQIGPAFGRVAREADQAGLHSLWVMDHFFQIAMVGPPEDPMLEGYSALAYAAALTERITLGTMVTGVTYRHPGILLKTVTTLDVLSGGRAWLGIGAAWYEEEARGLGAPFPPVAERFERLEETLEIAHRMWKGDESAFRGGHYSLERPLNSPPALTRPHPPILIGGGGEKKTLRLVARYADACNLFDGDELHHKLDVLRGHCEREGRDFAEIEKTSLGYFSGTPSVGEAVDTIGRLAESGVDHAIFSQGSGQDLAGVLGEALAQTGKIVPAGR